MDFEMKKCLKHYMKENGLFPKIDQANARDLDKIIHHEIIIDTFHILEYERKHNWQFCNLFSPLKYLVSYISALLCDFIFEDGELGNWLFQQVLEDELRKEYDHPAVRVSLIWIFRASCLNFAPDLQISRRHWNQNKESFRQSHLRWSKDAKDLGQHLKSSRVTSVVS